MLDSQIREKISPEWKDLQSKGSTFMAGGNGLYQLMTMVERSWSISLGPTCMINCYCLTNCNPFVMSWWWANCPWLTCSMNRNDRAKSSYYRLCSSCYRIRGSQYVIQNCEPLPKPCLSSWMAVILRCPYTQFWLYDWAILFSQVMANHDCPIVVRHHGLSTLEDW